MVAECWLGEKPEGYEIDHIDRNSQNNDYRNLRYVTRSEQMKNRTFESMTAAARYLADEYQKTVEHMRAKLKKRRKKIYEYDVMYECRD